MEFTRIKLSELIPYDNNPRINDYAIEPVMESIKQVGDITPIIVDENNVILAGHTRYEALLRLDYEEANCVVMSGMTEEQKKKYRILDNKTSELAEWDEDLLRGELDGLDLDGIHWFDDILNPNITEMATGSAEKETKEKKDKEDDGIVRCPRCGSIVDGPESYMEIDEDDGLTSWSVDEQEV